MRGIRAGLADGTIDAIVTDHAPHTAGEKSKPLPDAPSGMVGLETSLALALTGLYHTGLLPLAQVLDLMSASPAALLGLDKGTLAVGRDADLILFDPDQAWIIDKTKFASKGRNTPFHGRTVRGKVKYTISQGNIRNFLHREGIPSSQIYLTRNLGLSMTDCYWIKPLESDLIWEKVNLFTNDFGSETTYPGSVLQTGWPGGCETGVYGFTPASSVQGELKKKWVIEEGERYLVKGNYGSSYQQSLNEIMASRMHKALHFQHYTEYSLCNLRVKLDQYESSHAMGCYSRAFTDENLEFISGYEICESRKKDNELSEYENFIQICIENGLDKNEVRAFMEHQILTDFVITNTDRHFNNFGILSFSLVLQRICLLT